VTSRLRREPRDRQERIPWREVVVAAVRAGRRHWKRVLVAAAVVFCISSLIETALEGLAGHSSNVLIATLAALAFGFDMLGEVFFAGLLERLVGEAGHDAPDRRTLDVLRTLPYGRLILADVLVTAAIILGLFALVVPGIVLYTLLAVTGPIVNIESRSAVSAMRRSASLVRRHFWLTLLLVTVPLMLADSISSSVERAVHGFPLAADFGVRAALAILLNTATALVQVELSYRLKEEADRQPA
jgi:hypothetical protein